MKSSKNTSLAFTKVSRLNSAQRTVGIILSVIIIVVIVAGTYIVHPMFQKGASGAKEGVQSIVPVVEHVSAKSAVGEWGQYVNSAVGFEFKYPTSWSLQANSKNQNRVAFSVPSVNEYTVDSVTVDVVDNARKLGIEEWLQSSAYYSQSKADKIQADLKAGKREIGLGYRQENLTVDGKAVIDQYLDGPGGSVRNVFIPVNNKVVVFSMGSDFHFTSSKDTGSEVYGLLQTFNKVLGTFHITH